MCDKYKKAATLVKIITNALFDRDMLTFITQSAFNVWSSSAHQQNTIPMGFACGPIMTRICHECSCFIEFIKQVEKIR